MTVVVPQATRAQPGAVSGRLGYEVAVGALLWLAAALLVARWFHVARRPRRPRRRQRPALPDFSISRVDPPTPQVPVVLDGPTFRISIASADPADVVRVLTEVAAVELR